VAARLRKEKWHALLAVAINTTHAATGVKFSISAADTFTATFTVPNSSPPKIQSTILHVYTEEIAGAGWGMTAAIYNLLTQLRIQIGVPSLTAYDGSFMYAVSDATTPPVLDKEEKGGSLPWEEDAV